MRSIILGSLLVPVMSGEWGMGVGPRNITDQIEHARQAAEMLQDYEIKMGSGMNSHCSADMRHAMPACLQHCDMWCWATVAAMAANYYEGKNDCDGSVGECAVATHSAQHHGWKDPPKSCCPATDHCNPKDGDDYVDDHCNIGGGEDKIITELEHFTGGSFKQDGPLSQSDLDRALNAGKVVMMSITWKPVGRWGGHWLIIGGCGNGKYYVHDPYAWYDQMQGKTPPSWQTLAYKDLLNYPSPGVYREDGGENVGVWDSSVMSSLNDAEHADALRRADANRGFSVLV